MTREKTVSVLIFLIVHSLKKKNITFQFSISLTPTDSVCANTKKAAFTKYSSLNSGMLRPFSTTCHQVFLLHSLQCFHNTQVPMDEIILIQTSKQQIR